MPFTQAMKSSLIACQLDHLYCNTGSNKNIGRSLLIERPTLVEELILQHAKSQLRIEVDIGVPVHPVGAVELVIGQCHHLGETGG